MGQDNLLIEKIHIFAFLRFLVRVISLAGNLTAQTRLRFAKVIDEAHKIFKSLQK